MLGAVAWLGTGRRGSQPIDDVLDDVLGEPLANLPPVLLPEDVRPPDVDRIRFSLGFRGYRMDQVDQVLDRLRDQIAARDAEIARLQQSSASNGTASENLHEH